VTLTIKSIYRSLLPSKLRRRLWDLRNNRREARARARDQRYVRLSVSCNVCQGRNIVPFQNRRVMISDIMEIEPALGAENAVLFVARKSGA
jgi:hypothetical protein